MSFAFIQAQSDCNLAKSTYSSLFAVTHDDIICMAKNSEKDISLFYSFTAHCSPCRDELPKIIKTAQEYDLDFHILLIINEWKTSDINRSIEFAQTIDSTLNYLILSDSLLTKRNRTQKKITFIETNLKEKQKYKSFLEAINPPELGDVDGGLGKCILINKEGKVLWITNLRDRGNEKGVDLTLDKVIEVIKEEREVE